MATIFTKIINGEIPSYKIAEDDKHYAFLDINPVVEGHTLVVPKKENDYLFNLEDDELADLMVFAKKVARKLETKIDVQKDCRYGHRTGSPPCPHPSSPYL